MRKHYLILLIVLLTLSSCAGKVKRGVTNYIKNECSFTLENDSCIMDINDFLDFEWDRLYILHEIWRTQDISELLGFDYKGSWTMDNDYRYIFICDNKVVYEEEYSDYGNYFYFNDYEYPDLHMYISPLFIIKRITDENSRRGYYYSILPLMKNPEN